jgi:hypothetical protein
MTKSLENHEGTIVTVCSMNGEELFGPKKLPPNSCVADLRRDLFKDLKLVEIAREQDLKLHLPEVCEELVPTHVKDATQAHLFSGADELADDEYLPGDNFLELSVVFTNTASLKVDLSNKKVDNQGVKAFGKCLCKVPDAIQLYKSLTSLNVRFQGNRISAEGTTAFGQSLSHFTTLTSLRVDLCHNSIGNEGVKAFGQELSNLTSLTSLSVILQHTRIDNEGVDALGQSLSHLTSLTSLYVNLMSNDLSNLKAFGQSLSHLTNLISLEMDLFSKKIGKKTVEAFKRDLRHIPSLKVTQ